MRDDGHERPGRSQSVLAELNEDWRCLCCGASKCLHSVHGPNRTVTLSRAQYTVQLRSLTAIKVSLFFARKETA